MDSAAINYLPLSASYLLLLVALFGVLAAVVFLRAVRHAYVSMGVAPQWVLAALLLSLAGSYVNIPLVHFPGERIVADREILFLGVRYLLPVVQDWPGTILAVNLGGAVIPALMSFYLIGKKRVYWQSLLGVAVVSFICHRLSYPVPGLGIAIPVFIPPVASALVALALSRRDAAPLAYICGSLGTLIGADLLNLDWVRGLGAPVTSIGGAGTFDGIFVTGLAAVLIASMVTSMHDPVPAPS